MPIVENICSYDSIIVFKYSHSAEFLEMAVFITLKFCALNLLHHPVEFRAHECPLAFISEAKLGVKLY